MQSKRSASVRLFGGPCRIDVEGIIGIRNKMLHFMGYWARMRADRHGGDEGVPDLVTIGYIAGLY